MNRMEKVISEPYWHQDYQHIYDTYVVKLRWVSPMVETEGLRYRWWLLKSNVSCWLQKKAWKFLQKHADVQQYRKALEREVRYKKVELDILNLSKCLLKHTDVLYAIFRHEVDTIFLGGEALSLLKMEATKNWYSFKIPFDVNPSLHDSKGTLYSLAGMNIVCIPWFSGILAIDSKKVLKSNR